MASATAIEADGSWLKAAHAKRRVSGSERAEVRVHTTALCSPTRQALLTEIMPGDWIFMERSGTANAFIPQRNIGLRLHRSFADGRATYSAGAFND